MTPNSAIDFVVKISKFCNLRCSYCYEYAELGERRRMRLDDLRAFFLNVRTAVREYGRDRIHFIWHGGEPFLVPLDYYERIGELQREIFGDGIECLNLVQTNLTVLTERHIEFVREQRFFANSLGVSFDVYGDQRVDTRGRLRTETVLSNMQRLKDGGVSFGAITVLARNTVERVEEIYRFYDSLGVSVRFLPFYKSSNDAQVAQHALSFEEITTSLKKIFDAWLVSETATIVHPLEDYIRYALAAIAGGERHVHRPEDGEQVFLVDTDGATYGVADTYDGDHQYGNVFREDFGRRAQLCRPPACRTRGTGAHDSPLHPVPVVWLLHRPIRRRSDTGTAAHAGGRRLPGSRSSAAHRPSPREFWISAADAPVAGELRARSARGGSLIRAHPALYPASFAKRGSLPTLHPPEPEGLPT